MQALKKGLDDAGALPNYTVLLTESGSTHGPRF